MRNLNTQELQSISGGGIFADLFEMEVMLKASIARGLWDGFMGNEPAK